MTNCPFCSGAATDLAFVKEIPRGRFPIHRCRTCLGAFAWPRPDPAAVKEIYVDEAYGSVDLAEADSADRGYRPDSWADARRILGRCTELTAGKSLFDVGAGGGVFTSVARTMGFEVFACEPSPGARRIFAARNGFAPEASFLDEALAARCAGAFDVVLLNHVLEHIPDPAAAAESIRRVLKPGGIAAIAVPHFGSALSRVQGRADMFISPPEHLNYFSRPALISLFLRSGFRPAAIETSSKLPRRYVAGILRFPGLIGLGWTAGYGLLKATEWVGLGMVLIGYFRKARGTRAGA